MSTERAARVLVVEDDDEIAQVLQRSLRLEGYEVRIALDGEQALAMHAEYVPDVVILDLGLPKVDGIEVAKKVRGADDVPILMLTARDAIEARVEGLDSGADDYLVKPFERQELLARLRALLRRRPPRGMAPLRVGDLTLNPDTHEVSRADRSIDLTQREFELLEYLMRNERLVISRQKLLDEVWGYDPFSITNTIEVFVSNLRRKLDSSIRSAARATYSAYKRQPIRWRLAGGSAALTLVILCGFAVIVGTLTTRAIYENFNRQVASAADRLQSRLSYRVVAEGDNHAQLLPSGPDLNEYATTNNAAIRVVDLRGALLQPAERSMSRGAPNLGSPVFGDEVVD